jgi:hypothetical protein
MGMDYIKSWQRGLLTESRLLVTDYLLGCRRSPDRATLARRDTGQSRAQHQLLNYLVTQLRITSNLA